MRFKGVKINGVFSRPFQGVGPLLHFFFVCASVIPYVEFVYPYLFLISPSFNDLGGLCFMITAIPGCLHIFFHE